MITGGMGIWYIIEQNERDDARRAKEKATAMYIEKHGHTMSCQACSVCGDLDGCHEPARLAAALKSPTTILDWQRASYARAAEKGFHAEDPTLSERERLSVANNNIVGEVSELWEAYRAGALRKPCDKAERMAAMGLRPLTCIEEEMADIFLRLCDNAHAFGVDLQSAVEIKHAYNGTRAARHGGKLA